MPPEPPADTPDDRISETISHASCVRWGQHGLLLRGASGAGKSDLSLRLIGRGAVLVADDLVRLTRRLSHVVAGPVGMPGAIELRGQGIYQLACANRAEVTVCIELDAASAGERLQPPASVDLLGIALPLFRLNPQCCSTVDRLRALLTGERVA